MIEKICVICSKKCLIHKCRENKFKTCSSSCRGKYVGLLRRKRVKPRISTQGYYFIHKPGYHRSNKQHYAKVADLVLEEKIGRRLKKNEIAHHINGIRTDDRPENLEVMTKKFHDLHTTKERWRKWREEGRWSYKWDHCVNCKSKDKKHSSRGLCTTCAHLFYRGKMSLLEVQQAQLDHENFRRNGKEQTT